MFESVQREGDRPRSATLGTGWSPECIARQTPVAARNAAVRTRLRYATSRQADRPPECRVIRSIISHDSIPYLHSGRATVLPRQRSGQAGRRNVSHGKHPLPHATRRSGMTALPSAGSNTHEKRTPGQRTLPKIGLRGGPGPSLVVPPSLKLPHFAPWGLRRTRRRTSIRILAPPSWNRNEMSLGSRALPGRHQNLGSAKF
jgi:hypothetical protein